MDNDGGKLGLMENHKSFFTQYEIGEFHDQGDAKWILNKRSLWGHNDTPGIFGVFRREVAPL
jgi:hypothetical protein